MSTKTKLNLKNYPFLCLNCDFDCVSFDCTLHQNGKYSLTLALLGGDEDDEGHGLILGTHVMTDSLEEMDEICCHLWEIGVIGDVTPLPRGNLFIEGTEEVQEINWNEVFENAQRIKESGGSLKAHHTIQ